MNIAIAIAAAVAGFFAGQKIAARVRGDKLQNRELLVGGAAGSLVGYLAARHFTKGA